MDAVMQDTLRINKEIGRGLAAEQSKDIEQYIHEVMQCASHSFPPGLRYVGHRRATPDEQLKELTRLRRKRRTHELAKSDLYHYLFLFEYEGVPLKPRYIQLPFIRPGGIMRVRGSSFVVSPVLADNIFSIDNSKIYMPVTRSKITFSKEPTSFIEDDEVLSVDAIHSPIFNVINKSERNVKSRSLLMHYILAKYGLADAFKRYFKTDIVIVPEDKKISDYNKRDWVICRSRGIPPKSMVNVQYEPCSIVIAVPRSTYTSATSSAMGSLFYIMDHEPDMMDRDHLNNPMLWRRILPRFIKNDVGVEKKAMEEMEAHMISLDAYMDDLVRRKLQHEHIPCEDIYDVFSHIIEHFPRMTMDSKPASMLNKRLETVRFLMFDVVSAIFNLMFDLVKLSGTRLHRESIERTFDQASLTDRIQLIHTGHGEVSTLESATDCMLYSVTKSMVPQAKATATSRVSKSREMVDPAYALDASQCLMSTYLFTSKSDPSARGTVNPFIVLNEHGEPQHSKEDLAKMEQLNEMFKR